MQYSYYSDIYTLEILAKAAYKYNKDLPDEWIQEYRIEDVKTGFYAKVFKCTENGEIVISFSGTDIFPKSKNKTSKEKIKDAVSTIMDLYSDINMAMNLLPLQLKSAKKLYKEIEQKYPNSAITLTGESLGGTLAALCGAETGKRTYTFRAFGIADAIPDKKNKKYENIINIGDAQDYIFMLNIDKHIGKTFVIPDENNDIYKPNIFTGMNFHKDGVMCLADAIEYKKEQGKTIKEKFMDYSQIYLEKTKEYLNNARYELNNTIKNTISKIKENSNKKYENFTNGHWVTIDHNHVFIKD